MAIQKEIVAPTGAVATYWTVQSIAMNYLEKRAQIIIYGYANEEARNNVPSNYIHRKIFNIYGDHFEIFGTDELSIAEMCPIKACYEYIKTHDEDFKDAINV
ncbi:hypothetical protein [Clostridium sp. YIM B02551]|uniref:hypothetical protein n=1 Tax=Clostridium sp. YIM B02551 TaxID=2910679 RepID=UPI001EE9E247|nr:hypothetical protein [Clostridium sp. YIM B02551]